MGQSCFKQIFITSIFLFLPLQSKEIHFTNNKINLLTLQSDPFFNFTLDPIMAASLGNIHAQMAQVGESEQDQLFSLLEGSVLRGDETHLAITGLLALRGYQELLRKRLTDDLIQMADRMSKELIKEEALFAAEVSQTLDELYTCFICMREHRSNEELKGALKVCASIGLLGILKMCPKTRLIIAGGTAIYEALNYFIKYMNDEL